MVQVAELSCFVLVIIPNHDGWLCSSPILALLVLPLNMDPCQASEDSQLLGQLVHSGSIKGLMGDGLGG